MKIINKLLNLDKIKKKNSKLEKIKNKKIILVMSLDILHFGHIKYFKSAKKLGILQSASYHRFVIKGKNRPIFNSTIRAEVLEANNRLMRFI